MKTMRTISFAVAVILAVSLNASATIVDLTTAGADGLINGAQFIQDNFEKSTGTGVFDPFVRIQNNGSEAGFNTDGGVQFEYRSFAHDKLKGRERDEVIQKAFEWCAETLGVTVEELVAEAKSRMQTRQWNNQNENFNTKKS